ncbi:MAG: MBL fold metallo-hydrolase [Spirochaetales bacterium]|nr:MBL fold metallo-hydrolase [Spirochaetales bacterium]
MDLLETRGPHAFGSWSVTQLVEWEGEGMTCAEFFPGIPESEVRKHSPAGADRRLGRDGHLVMSTQIFILRRGSVVALVDLGAGNGKARPAEPYWNNLNRPYLETLASLGVAPDAVTHVFFTHLHVDHVGLATTKKNGDWIPTFPRAVHVVGKTEFEFWNDPAPGGGGRPPSFVDSVLPLKEAGLVQWVEPGDSIAGVRLHDAAGHSPGALLLELEGENVWLTGDLFHHPAQIARPDWPSGAFDWDQEKNTRCRTRWLARFAETGAVLFATHLGNALRVETTAEGGFFPKRGR